jgi:exodeoxyribonuclease VII small subunit
MAKKTFEQTMEELEQVVRQLENGDIPLEESLDLFEQGIKLTKSCQTMLDSAEKKVSMLVAGENGKIEKQDFTADED